MSIVGQRFAYRERMRAYSEPVRPVEVVREGPPRLNKVRVLWLDGEYEGLEEWVPKMRLLAPWEEAEELMEDENRMIWAVEYSGEACDDLTWDAVETVFFAMAEHASAEDELILGYKAFENQLLFVHHLASAAISPARKILRKESQKLTTSYSGDYWSPALSISLVLSPKTPTYGATVRRLLNAVARTRRNEPWWL